MIYVILNVAQVSQSAPPPLVSQSAPPPIYFQSLCELMRPPQKWTLAEVAELGKDPRILYEHLLESGIIKKPNKCNHCNRDGFILAIRRGVPWFRCSWSRCRRWSSCTTGSFLEHHKITPAVWCQIVYLWSVLTPFSTIKQITGMSGKTIAKILTHIQNVIMIECKANPPHLGGRKTTVEVDETELGHKQKAHKGRPSEVMMDVWGAVDPLLGKHLVNPKELENDAAGLLVEAVEE